jgi:[acyl-carrier-protein] S-malonyltransferase
MFDGSEMELRATHYAQPALFSTSLAIIRVLEQEFGITAQNWRMIAGHSLGEYTALHAAGVVSLAQALTLIHARGKAMATIENGGMVAVIGLLPDALSKMIQDLNHEGVSCVLANDNSPQQAVLSAASPHLPVLVERSRALGAIKSVILNVSGPFHSPMMQPAEKLFTSIRSPLKIPIVPS